MPYYGNHTLTSEHTQVVCCSENFIIMVPTPQSIYPSFLHLHAHHICMGFATVGLVHLLEIELTFAVLVEPSLRSRSLGMDDPSRFRWMQHGGFLQPLKYFRAPFRAPSKTHSCTVRGRCGDMLGSPFYNYKYIFGMLVIPTCLLLFPWKDRFWNSRPRHKNLGEQTSTLVGLWPGSHALKFSNPHD